MKEYIERQKAKEAIAAYCAPIKNSLQALALNELLVQLDVLPAADVVSKDLYEQIKWERDAALAQLKEYGVSLGEKADVVEVRHGRWEERPVNVDTPTTDLFCSECNFASYHWRYNYCPICGAIMDKEE